jgi:hypothetical protein
MAGGWSLITGVDAERYFSLHEDLIEFDRLFSTETSDRSLAIVGAAFVDTLMEHILRNFLVADEKEVARLLKPDQALGTFGSRAVLIYCLGLVGKIIRNDLRLLAKIRNRFAHDLRVSFEDEPVRSWCRDFKWHEIGMMMPAPDGATTREIFEVSVNQLICHLNGIASIARIERRLSPMHS